MLNAGAVVAGAALVAFGAPGAHAESPHARHDLSTSARAVSPSTDIEKPAPLPAKDMRGVGINARVSYDYALDADAGKVGLTVTGNNKPSTFTSAAAAVLVTAKGERLCEFNLGNVTKRTTKHEDCNIATPQPLVVRIDLDPESLDYRVKLDGPLKLPRRGVAQDSAAASPLVNAATPSTDIDAPTPLPGTTVKGEGTNRATTYYYVLTAGPGSVTLTGDGKNKSAVFTSALQLTLQDAQAKPLCTLSLGNVTRDARKVVTCNVPTQQRLILRVDLSPETICWRAKVESSQTPAGR